PRPPRGGRSRSRRSGHRSPSDLLGRKGDFDGGSDGNPSGALGIRSTALSSSAQGALQRPFVRRSSPMAQSTAPTPRPPQPPEPTHACIRCGRPGVPAEKAMCEDCNPLDLAQPSATQVHGIAAVGILVFVAILAVVARWSLAGTGPFVGTV